MHLIALVGLRDGLPARLAGTRSPEISKLTERSAACADLRSDAVILTDFTTRRLPELVRTRQPGSGVQPDCAVLCWLREVEMKGIMFNLVEEVVVDRFDVDTWKSLLDSAGVDGTYNSLESYPDGDFFRLVGAAGQKLGVSADKVVRDLAEAALPLLAERYPAFFAPFESARPFLLTLNDAIHPEVRMLYPGAEIPDFDFDASDSEVLVIGYRSPRRLCALAEGFIIGTARLYHQDAQVSQLACLKHGDPKCLIACRFTATAPPD